MRRLRFAEFKARHDAPPRTLAIAARTHDAPPRILAIAARTHDAPPRILAIAARTHDAPPRILAIAARTHDAPPRILAIAARTHDAPPRILAIAALTLIACHDEHAPPAASPTPAIHDAGTSHAVDAGPPPPAPLPPAVDPGVFPRFGCATDAMPPHIAVGTATVGWQPAHGQGFHFRNVPARCGAAYPGQLLDGVRLRPGEGAEFVVCMPDERRLDIGFLRRGTVPGGTQDVAHTEGLVRLRIGLDRYLDLVSPAGTADPMARLEFGTRLRTATGSARLAHEGTHGFDGVVTFEIDCSGRPPRSP